MVNNMTKKSITVKEWAEMLLKLPDEWLNLNYEDFRTTTFNGITVAIHPKMPPVINEFKGGKWEYLQFEANAPTTFKVEPLQYHHRLIPK